MFRYAPLLLGLAVLLAAPSNIARAAPQPSGPEWSIFVGAWVEVKKTDGTVVRGRMWRISDRLIVVNRGKRSTVIPVTRIAMMRRLLSAPKGDPGAAPRLKDLPGATPARPTYEMPKVGKKARPSPSPTKGRTFHVEWFTLSAFGGGGVFGGDFFGGDGEGLVVGGGELGLFSLVWKHAYFDILRFTGGVPFLFALGTGFGLRGVLDSAERYEMRLGLHVTCPYYMMFIPAMSGLDFRFLVRFGRRFRLQLGLKVFAFPPAAVVGAGISY